MDPLLALTCAALSGLASRPNGGHGIPAESAEQIGARAVEMAKGALNALDALHHDEHKAKPKRGG